LEGKGLGSETLKFDSGAHWLRWEPHIHAPGTVLNDQFKGGDVWEDYLAALESRTPVIRALGVTDYYSLKTYERVQAEKAKGRLPQCDLVFPNVELRLKLGTVRGAWVNLHLLVSPDDPNHVEEIKRILSRLTFDAHEDRFACRADDLVRLGKKADESIVDTMTALRHGTEQFKVSFDQLKEVYNGSAWAKEHVLVAVAGGSGDGTSGVRAAADTTLRQEVERFAHIIFASSNNQRDFWLGRNALGPDELKSRYNGLKPCIHGSDGHSVDSAGVPAEDRYTWIKGAVIFDALWQAVIDPAGRAWVGEKPPISALPNQVIAGAMIGDASWAKTSKLQFNPGLVAIIGARGSGKTALADIIAAGCDALPSEENRQSFLYRARDYLEGSYVRIAWQEGDVQTRSLDGSDFSFADRYPRARYLSQQFVEELCASDGMTDALLREIERVIFDAHDLASKDGALDFVELRDLRAARYRQARRREETALATLSERIGAELEKIKLVDELKKQISEKTQLIARHNADRAKLVSKGSKERVNRLEALTNAAETVRSYVRHFNNQEQDLLLMKDEVEDLRNNKAPETLRVIREQHAASGLNDEDWSPFLLDYKGDVDGILAERLTKARQNIAGWKGAPRAAQTADQPLIADDADLERQPLALLEAEIARIEKLVNVDRNTAQRFSALSRKIVEEADALKRLNEKLVDCVGAKDRATALVADREATYRRVFDAILGEETVLTNLYAPIRARLAQGSETLRKLSFTVSRIADVEQWADEGEQLLDLRRQGSFRGQGALQKQADAILKRAWESGDAEAVANAMTEFRREHQDALLEHAQVPRSDQSEYRAWSKRFAQWLYSAEHITIRYSVDYDGVDIRKLSPGTRGIVLLLLYLALDDADDRPLIIDQPEENLDPKSIFDELVGLFIDVKSKRQVIMVTHNANLVINTDADQIVIARAGPHVSGDLPPISYLSGGLERAEIRQAVCDILEGGEVAFRERARRLRVRLKR
jgi:putative AbiEii toxin of type IV toxin-antitoxin system/AAA domain-containing protein